MVHVFISSFVDTDPGSRKNQTTTHYLWDENEEWEEDRRAKAGYN